MAIPLAQTVISSAASAVAGKGVEQVAKTSSDKKSMIFLGGGIGLLVLYAMSSGKNLKYVDIPKKWAMFGGLGLLAYGGYCFFKYKKENGNGGNVNTSSPFPPTYY